jgi:phosphoglycerate kinase
MYKSLDNADVLSKKVLLRVDLNVPIINGEVTDYTRIHHILPTLNELTTKGAKVILLTHFGRPKGKKVEELSVFSLLKPLSNLTHKNVVFCEDIDLLDKVIDKISNGDVILLENIRFYEGEEKNDKDFSKKIASYGDIYVNDAFSAAHRAHASTEGITYFLPSYVGRGMQAELEALEVLLGKPEKPVTAVIGGAKISTKIPLLENLIEKVDNLIIGGGMANTFLAAQGYKVGKSLCEHDLLELARSILEKAKKHNTNFVLPIDVIVAMEFAEGADNRECNISDVNENEMILDAGEKTVENIVKIFEESKTIVWNGPLGAFELYPFDRATVEAAKQAAYLCSMDIVKVIAGGGDTVAALNHAGVAQDFTYVSTAGGAFLEWLEGKELPGVKALAA